MKNLIVVMLLIALIAGCSDEPGLIKQDRTNEIKIKNGRLEFRDSESFYNTISMLNKMSDVELNDWEASHNIYSMNDHFVSIQDDDSPYTPDEAEYVEFPMSYLKVLNKDAEVKIGDTIVWYNRGDKHYALNDDQIKAIRKDPSQSKDKGIYFIQSRNLDSERMASSERFLTLGIGGLAAGYQKEFNYCYNQTLRKYVNELYAMYDNVRTFPPSPVSPGGFTFRSILYLKMKLEWKGSGGWKIAGEYRFINYNINYDIKFCFSPPLACVPTSGYANGTRSSNGTLERNSLLEVNLYEVSGTRFNGDPLPSYNFEIRGSIYQAISNKIPAAPGGLPCNPWTIGSAGVPLNCFTTSSPPPNYVCP